MRQKHLRSIDLNLLPVLDALLRHRNATRAGAEVGLSQPAMSRALGRLRDLLDDPLLVRGRLTTRAEALRQPLALMLAGVDRMLIEPEFDPASLRRTVRLAMTDAQAELLLAPLARWIEVEAPGVTLEWVPIGPGTAEAMATGAIDIAFALDTTPLPRGAKSEPLLRDRLAVVVRRGHPCGEQWKLEDYARFPSVVIAVMGDAVSEVDAELAGAGIIRPVRAIVPTFHAALSIVGATDCVTTVSRAYAARAAGGSGLVLLEPPLRQTALNVIAVWLAERNHDPLIRWLREGLCHAAAA